MKKIKRSRRFKYRPKAVKLKCYRMEGGLEILSGEPKAGIARCKICQATGGFWRGSRGYLVRAWRHKKGCPGTPPKGCWDDPKAEVETTFKAGGKP